MKITVVYPSNAHSAYSVAKDNFIDLVNKVSGDSVTAMTDSEFLKTDSHLTVVIGNDKVNKIISTLYGGLQIDYNKDEYIIKSLVFGGNNYLFLIGATPRATIYAVYRYFEVFCNSRWFWDGDRINKCALPYKDISLVETPKFDYRGIRYFAHRSLHRFQAEHWDFNDWKKEIDYLLKKRLNLFMLRIGMDDLWQKAFPDIVTYPSDDCVEEFNGEGYNDRTPFWNLKYRGELRKKILSYAFERDLLHPEDSGTMTHWYSKTPTEFIKKANPTLLPLEVEQYSGKESQVFDIRDKSNLDNYFKLTNTHVKEYGSDKIFHTIGLGERMYSKDREKNKAMKLYVYREICEYIKKTYPNSPLLIASWDLWMRFTPEEVIDLTKELDPSQAIIFDYTSDALTENNFTKWGVLGKFPWVFGIFGGYEPQNEIRGCYDFTNERIKLAKADPMCKGFVFWPEYSHGDNFMLEYFTANSWDSTITPISEQIDNYCRDRYPLDITSKMANIWHKFMPIVEEASWTPDSEMQIQIDNIFTDIITKTSFKKQFSSDYKVKVDRLFKLTSNAVEVLQEIASITNADQMTTRDLFDITRTVISRFLNATIYQAQYLYSINAPNSDIDKAFSNCKELLNSLTDLLSLSEDFSLLSSFNRLKTVTKVNPNFEKTLKNNAECNYCRSFIYENCKYLYIPEMDILLSEVKRCIESSEDYDKTKLESAKNDIKDNYFKTPLDKMQPTLTNFNSVLERAINLIKNLKA